MLDRLFKRFDDGYLARRLRLQVNYVLRLWGEGVGGLHVENLDPLFPLLEVGLRGVGLWQRGVRNIFEYGVTDHTLRVPRLPSAFDGLRLLHLSDLHVDGSRHTGGIGRQLHDAIRPLTFDLCVVTGDFRFATHGRYDGVHRELLELAPALQCEHGAYGILGNHDFVEEVAFIEDAGVRMLVNEAVRIGHGDSELYLVGLDDCHLYGTYDFDRALRNVPGGACTLMLVHSPEIAEEAEARGGCLYLTGHTHGGQICLPGGFAPFVNARCPRDRAVGSWRYRGMRGYTSAGTGVSGLPVRYNCPPEIAMHTLRPA